MAFRTDKSRVQALEWLAAQLRWERTLGELRHARHDRRDLARRAA